MSPRRRNGARAQDGNPGGRGAGPHRLLPDGGTGFDLGLLVRVAAIAAVVVAVIQVVLVFVRRLASGVDLRLVDLLVGQAIGVIGDLALFAAIVAVVTLGASQAVVLRAGIALYALELLGSILSTFAFGILSGGRPNVGLGTLISPLFTVALFLGIVMTYRLFQGQTILPGTSIRV